MTDARPSTIRSQHLADRSGWSYLEIIVAFSILGGLIVASNAFLRNVLQSHRVDIVRAAAFRSATSVASVLASADGSDLSPIPIDGNTLDSTTAPWISKFESPAVRNIRAKVQAYAPYTTSTIQLNLPDYLPKNDLKIEVTAQFTRNPEATTPLFETVVFSQWLRHTE